MGQTKSAFYKQAVIVGKKNYSKDGIQIDFYVSVPKHNLFLYAFSSAYSASVYQRCKGGIQIERLLSERTKNKAIMKTVKQAKRMIPYLVEYEWELAA